MITVGVDLAAEPKKTAVARISWSPAGVVVEQVVVDVDNATIVEVSADADKIGVDAPLGWPVRFVEFVRRHHESSAPVNAAARIADRDDLVNRRTDLAVRHRTGQIPLSVSTDRIGRATMRVAGLLPALDPSTDRSGRGRVVEVYPAAALRVWSITARRYKGGPNVATLGELSGQFFAAVPWLVISAEQRALCDRSDDAFDAVVAGLITRAAALGLTGAPGPDDLAAARVEGWIAVPTGPLSDLDPRR